MNQLIVKTQKALQAQHKKAKSTIEHPEPKRITVLQPTDNQQHKRQQNLGLRI